MKPQETDWIHVIIYSWTEETREWKYLRQEHGEVRIECNQVLILIKGLKT